jgi:DNA-directed RNA polymerase specialized sigma24 family protein
MNNDELMHYGTPRHSGRYPWGSGENPYQSSTGFYGMAKQLKSDGMSDKEIAESFGMSTREYKSAYSNAKNEVRAANRAEALRLKDKGYSNTAIGQRMGVNESTVRSWMDEDIAERSSISKNTAKALKSAVDDKKYIDIGGGVENQMGISRTALDNAVKMLKDEGYTVHYIQTEQLGTGHKTSIKVLAPPDTTYSEVWNHKADIEFPGFHSEDKGRTIDKIGKPVSISSKRIKINYAEEGGKDKDGVIELRRGVDDISLGKAKYAQVRIAVDGTHYLKGMAMYRDDMPDGVDIIFNTNKAKGTPMLGEKDNSVLKPMKKDQDNPFGATIKGERELILAQRYYTDKNGKRQQSALNIVNEEGDWNTWRKSLSSQMLSKQSPMLAKKQLKLAYDLKQDEFDSIMKLENPVIRQQLLDKFADGCDSASVHLKAAGLPRQASKVILPFPSMKENEVYAPSFRDGEEVVLIRYPHGGTFEIPRLKVNNKIPDAKKTLHNAQDAIGINAKVAERLSGADFDGDTVLVIPTSTAKIKTSKPLDGLKDFDPQRDYKAYPGMPEVKGSGFNKQQQMGNVSNLITDMTIKGATPDELARAVRHSMVIIDAEKHNLNYKQSAIDNNIAELKKKYQGGSNRGASTIISRASATAYVPVRKELTNTKYMTDDEKKRYSKGEKIYRETGETYISKKTGKEIKRISKSTKMAETSDANTLSSGYLIETVYSEHANKLKALANKARAESRSTDYIPYSKEAHVKYKDQVDSLNSKLNIALKNRPLERKAQLIANAKVKNVYAANPDMDSDDLKKLKGRCLTEARLQTGASKQQIKIEPKEWEAIQAGAISTNKLKSIVQNSDLDVLKQLAMPREMRGVTPAQESRIKVLESRGYTLAEIADAVGVSTGTITNVLQG